MTLVYSVPSRQKITLITLMDTYRGMKNSKILSDELDHLPLYSTGNDVLSWLLLSLNKKKPFR